MTGRDKIRQALRHQDGPVPIDFGATPTSGVHVSVVAALREHFGLSRHPVKVIEPYQMLGELEPDLLEAIGADAEPLWGRNTIFGFPNENWRTFRLPWGQEVLVSEHFRTTDDGRGGLLIFPQGDTAAPPSGHMPAGSYFFDAVIRQQPLDEDALDPADNLEEFGPISQADLDYIAARAAALGGSDRAIVGSFGGTGFGDIALVPAPFLKHPRGIRDIAEWYMATAARPDYVQAVFERQCEIALENLERIVPLVRDVVDVLFVCGTDFGTQTSSFCAPATFDQLWLPHYRRVNDWIHVNTPWKTFKHSCGAVEGFMDRFISAGFDIVNPVQCSAVGMEPSRLKRRYGDRLTFWGGGVNTQQTLPFGTPAEVRAEVRSRCETFAPGGGFVFNAIHNVQANTPVANVVAMIDAVHAFNARG